MGKFLLLLWCLFTPLFCSYGQKQLEVVWDDALKFRSQDKAYEFGIGGRFHYDIVFLEHDKRLKDKFGEAADQVEVRRARISVDGTIQELYEYEFDVSFEAGLELNDMRFTFLKVPFVNRLTLGHFREPFGMEENTSSNDIVMMERSLTSAFGLSRNAGIMVQRYFWKERIGLHAGAFRITDDFGSDREPTGKHSFTTRIAVAPVLNNTANRVLHLGLGLNTHDLLNNTLEIESKNENNVGPDYISTSDIKNVERIWQAGGEAGFANGPFTLQGEYIYAYAPLYEVTSLPVQDSPRKFSSYYVTGSYFLGGGRRGYDTGDNTFSDISLNDTGAWEIALRYSGIRLLGSPQEFRKMHDITLGLNYYLNENMRLMGNYIFSRIEEHHAQVLQFRVQVSF